MRAEGGGHTSVMALEVADAESYARYRAGMAPLLAEHGGRFVNDFVVAEVLLGARPGVNRVFSIAFPDRASRQRIFSDPRYLAVRATWFEPAVRSVEMLGRLCAD